jgi:hypothetical protein
MKQEGRRGDVRLATANPSVGEEELRIDQALFLDLRLVRYLIGSSATRLVEAFLLLSKMTRT